MNAVERVKEICKERKIPLSRIEKDLGFANGYIGQLKKGTMPAERLEAISKYLDVSFSYLTTGEIKNYSVDSAELNARIFKDKELQDALRKYYALPETKRKHIIELINLFSE